MTSGTVALFVLVVLACSLVGGAIYSAWRMNTPAPKPVMPVFDEWAVWEGARVIGRLPESDRLAVMEMFEVAKNENLWQLYLPGIRSLIGREMDRRVN